MKKQGIVAIGLLAGMLAQPVLAGFDDLVNDVKSSTSEAVDSASDSTQEWSEKAEAESKKYPMRSRSLERMRNGHYRFRINVSSLTESLMR